MAPYQARVELWFSDSLREFALTKTEQLGDLLDRASMLPRFDRLSFAPRLEALRNWIEATSSNDEVAPGIPVLWSLETEMVGRAWEALIVEQGHERREKAKAARAARKRTTKVDYEGLQPLMDEILKNTRKVGKAEEKLKERLAVDGLDISTRSLRRHRKRQ